MPKKVIIAAFIIAVAALVGVVAVKNQKKEVSVTNATVRYIQAGHTGVACQDARWLIDVFGRFIVEKQEQMDKYEKPFVDNNTQITDEALFAMQQEMQTNPSPAQKEIDQWHGEVLIFIRDLYKGDATKLRSTEDAVGADITAIYQGAMMVTLGMQPEAEVRKTIEEHYCSGDIH